MRTARLLGREHTELGVVSALSEGAAAIALCRGGAPKRYPYLDPNEDAALFATGDHGALLAVCDGHDGADGAERALAWLESEHAPRWLGPEPPARDEAAWREEVRGVLCALDRDLALRAHSRGLAPAATTLSFAVIRPAEGWLLHGHVGDSHLFCCEAGDARDVSLHGAAPGARPRFAGSGTLGDEALEHIGHAGREALGPLSCVVLATDGLSEQRIGVSDPGAAVIAAVAEARRGPDDVRPLAIARGLVEIALGAHRDHDAGDNVASAVVCLDG